jgi:hypothetical protein
MDPQVQNAAVAVGLVILGLLGLVVIWKITKSVLKLMFWLIVLLVLGAGTVWLLGEAQIIPRPATWIAPPPMK